MAGETPAMFVLRFFIVFAVLGTSASEPDSPTLGSVRDSLIRQEDTIIFSLIERARLPLNDRTYAGNPSVFHTLAQKTEAVQAEDGRYLNQEENPFFPEKLPQSAVLYNFPKVLKGKNASLNINDRISKAYFLRLKSLVNTVGEDGNFAITASLDLTSLQAISRRIHMGKFVAEAKFLQNQTVYGDAIRARDSDRLRNMLTDTATEAKVIERVRKKAMVFGQDVTLGGSNSAANVRYKVDPSFVAKLYEEAIIPLTKDIEIGYLLGRLG